MSESSYEIEAWSNEGQKWIPHSSYNAGERRRAKSNLKSLREKFTTHKFQLLQVTTETSVKKHKID